MVMGYAPVMNIRLLSVSSGIVLLFAAAFGLRADEVNMQNGDRYFGHVVSVSADTVVLNSEVLGKINVPRKNVASLAFGTNTFAPKAVTSVAPVSVPTNLPVVAAPTGAANTNLDFSAALQNPGLGANSIRQIREQMLAGSPEAAGKFDTMVNGLLSSSMSMDDLRREAKSSADQLRALKRDLGPEASESLDGYLEVLDGFLKESETSAAPANTSAASKK